MALVSEQIAAEGTPLAPVVYEQVLPEVEPAFAAILELNAAKTTNRWTAAENLAAMAAEHPLSGLAVEHLANAMAKQKDPLVWQSVLAAVTRDGREPAARLAYMALSNESPEVRRRACEYLDMHAGPQHAQALLPLIDDPHGTVVVAAVRAIGSGGALERPGAAGGAAHPARQANSPGGGHEPGTAQRWRRARGARAAGGRSGCRRAA